MKWHPWNLQIFIYNIVNTWTRKYSIFFQKLFFPPVLGSICNWKELPRVKIFLFYWSHKFISLMLTFWIYMFLFIVWVCNLLSHKSQLAMMQVKAPCYWPVRKIPFQINYPRCCKAHVSWSEDGQFKSSCFKAAASHQQFSISGDLENKVMATQDT